MRISPSTLTRLAGVGAVAAGLIFIGVRVGQLIGIPLVSVTQHPPELPIENQRSNPRRELT